MKGLTKTGRAKALPICPVSVKGVNTRSSSKSILKKTSLGLQSKESHKQGRYCSTRIPRHRGRRSRNISYRPDQLWICRQRHLNCQIRRWEDQRGVVKSPFKLDVGPHGKQRRVHRVLFRLDHRQAADGLARVNHRVGTDSDSRATNDGS